jgi:DNA adenine methylase
VPDHAGEKGGRVKYLGGKSRLGKRIAEIIRAEVGSRPFWDPFCGGLASARALIAGADASEPCLISDVNPALIAMYQAVADGWPPPETLSREEYDRARTLPDSDPLKAFAGFASSWGGKWFAGYAAPEDRVVRSGSRTGYRVVTNPADIGARAVRRDVLALRLRGAIFARLDFLEVAPEPCPLVIYCDPPYVETTGYAAVGAFDYDRFRSRVREWARFTPVFVSEYTGSTGWERVAEFPRTTKGLHSGRVEKAETLFRVCP